MVPARTDAARDVGGVGEVRRRRAADAEVLADDAFEGPVVGVDRHGRLVRISGR